MGANIKADLIFSFCMWGAHWAGNVGSRGWLSTVGLLVEIIDLYCPNRSKLATLRTGAGIIGDLRHPISMTSFGNRSNFKALQLATVLISADGKFYIEIRLPTYLRVRVNQHIHFPLNVGGFPLSACWL